MERIERLVSLPPAAAGFFRPSGASSADGWFADSDPEPLGSAGGTAYLLWRSWLAASSDQALEEWLRSRRALVLHSGGLSRRLPAYACLGKAMMPFPVVRNTRGQRPDQRFRDLAEPFLSDVLQRSPDGLRLCVASGDVLLHGARLRGPIPEADVVCLALPGRTDVATRHGVFLSPRGAPGSLDRFLQKPPKTELDRWAATHRVLLDVGVWLFSDRAVRALLEACRWTGEGFSNGLPVRRELYSDLALALGSNPTVAEGPFRGLSCALAEIDGAFLHFGTSAELIESTTWLHNADLHEPSFGVLTSAIRHPNQHVLNALFEDGPRLPDGARVWIENAAIDASWRFSTDHVVTNVPEGLPGVALPPGLCVDFVPIRGGGWCIRPYGFDDSFSGDWRTAQWMRMSVGEFLGGSGIQPDALGIPDGADVFDAPLFPVADSVGELHRWLRWYAAEPAARRASADRWLAARRLSARDLLTRADLGELEALRKKRLVRSLARMMERRRTSVFLNMDLEATAALLAEAPEPVPDIACGEDPPAHRMAASMFRAEYLRRRGDPDWGTFAEGAFAALRELIVRDEALGGLEPSLTTLPDQIVWGRSPLRLDFAGGWSDTPPYCLLHGGRVLNVAVDLNGQPPVQVFARRTDRPSIVLRSIDLGVEERIEEFEALERCDEPGSSFSLAKAALTLAGFGRRFAARPAPTLRDRLTEAGGGLELSLLAAVPKGSGLGTSSILAATLLATISDVAGLGWSKDDVIQRTLALEQLLTTGGGWQDQAGGCHPGLKVLETHPGLDQTPSCRWLSDRTLEAACAGGTALLYYTGITRLAKSVLGEIVRGMFLNSGPRLRTIRAIVDNVEPVADAIQRRDWAAFGRGIRRSWLLNRELDSGTSTPEIDAILAAVDDLIHGAKLLGAGGGGFLFLVAKDPEAGRRVRCVLEENPPSPRARFVSLRVSQVGLEVTRS